MKFDTRTPDGKLVYADFLEERGDRDGAIEQRRLARIQSRRECGRARSREVREFRTYASHHQFYVQDGDEPNGDTGTNFWSKRAVRDHLALKPDILGIGTASYGSVTIVVEIHDKKPPVRLSAWDHVTEAGIDIRSGMLRVIGCLADTHADFAVGRGHFRVRCCHAELAGGVQSGEGTDWYLVQVWPARRSPMKILKRNSARGL
jgi:hypothetical protein